MISVKVFLSCVFFVLILSSCAQTEKSTKKEESQSSGGRLRQVPLEALDPEKMVPAGSCRVVVTVIAVDPVASQEQDDPCSKAPCMASVRVDSILGCGSGFHGTLSSGSTIRARFATTLSPTKELFPKLEPSLPGLTRGSQFKALIRASTAAEYAIETYEAH